MSGRRWRRWVVAGLLVLGAFAIRVYGLGPAGSSRVQLQLLALDADSRFSADARLQRADPTADGPATFPLIFAIVNRGTRAAAPDSLYLSLPSWIRLLGEDGRPRVALDQGQTLVRYGVAMQGEMFEPGALPLVPGGIGRLRLAAELPAITCALRWDGVIEFVPAPGWDVERLATIDAYYSLNARDERYTGTVRLHIDPQWIAPPGASVYQAGELTVRRPAIALPNPGPMVLEGERRGICGAPELQLNYRSVVWRTGLDGAGRFIAIQQDGATRRLLYDLNGDGRIDSEAWDGDGDGQFESGRTASWAIPPFLLPLPSPAAADTARPDTPMPDTLRPATPDTVRPDTVRPDTVRPDTLPPDTLPGRRDSARRDSAATDPIRRDTLAAMHAPRPPAGDMLRVLR